MSRKLTLADIWRLVQDYSLPNSLPIVIVGENQVAVSAGSPGSMRTGRRWKNPWRC